ncbi:MAG TPA: AmmeMemoRadiSam system radical SAM enzyme, partial [Coxiellaceae bacterium]|nr:AmmeMemoRadiSam system radical SAM enzyme [Coxiellaceae bacterium]
MCFVRMRANDQIVLTTHSRSSGLAIDPIEKKPLNNFLPGSKAYSFGTAGCNLLCKFCQNWDISKARETDILNKNATPENIAKIAKEYGCKSVAFTYNEPIIFMEYAIDVAKECHKLGLKTVAVTNGYICDEPRKEFFSYMDAATVGLKGFTERFYKDITGSHLQPVLETLIYLKKYTNVWFEIVSLLIPDENDSAAEIEKQSTWIKENIGIDVPVHYTAFHPDWKMLDKPSTPLETLIQARDITMKNGL